MSETELANCGCSGWNVAAGVQVCARTPEARDWLPQNRPEWLTLKLALTVPAGNQLDTEKDTKRIPKKVPISGIEATQKDTQKGTGDTAQPIDWQAVECANDEFWNAFGLQDGPPSRQNRAYPSEPSEPKSRTGEAAKPEKT